MGSLASGTGVRKEDQMLITLHLWAAPVRNMDWVTSAFGYR